MVDWFMVARGLGLFVGRLLIATLVVHWLIVCWLRVIQLCGVRVLQRHRLFVPHWLGLRRLVGELSIALLYRLLLLWLLSLAVVVVWPGGWLVRRVLIICHCWPSKTWRLCAEYTLDVLVGTSKNRVLDVASD